MSGLFSIKNIDFDTLAVRVIRAQVETSIDCQGVAENSVEARVCVVVLKLCDSRLGDADTLGDIFLRKTTLFTQIDKGA
nr:MAG TPA: hypothetical protein [Caudoviricetes sp.]